MLNTAECTSPYYPNKNTGSNQYQVQDRKCERTSLEKGTGKRVEQSKNIIKKLQACKVINCITEDRLVPTHFLKSFVPKLLPLHLPFGNTGWTSLDELPHLGPQMGPIKQGADLRSWDQLYTIDSRLTSSGRWWNRNYDFP